MNLFLRSVLMFLYSLNILAMMSGGSFNTLPWKTSSFDAKFQQQQTQSKSAVQNNKTDTILTVVFDMDETILWQRSPELQEPVYRYGMLELLNHLRQLGTVRMLLWTAAKMERVDDILRSFFHRIITRDDGNWFKVFQGSKPLRILSDVHPERVVMFDDRSESIQEDQYRALLVHAFHGPSGLEHEPKVDPNDFTHEHIRELVGYLLSQIEAGKTVPKALETYSSTPGILEWHHCPTLERPFLRIQREKLTEDSFSVRVDSFADVDDEGEASE